MKTRLAEETEQPAYSFFDPTEAGPLVPSETSAAAAVLTTEEALLDRVLAAVKWIFLYVPGVAYIHMLIVGLGLSTLYEDWPTEIIIQLIGAIVIGTFMIMLGVGKLSDLKYLRVVAGVIAASALGAVIYLILAAFFAGDFFGTFYQLSLPVVLFVGYLLKRYTDATYPD